MSGIRSVQPRLRFWLRIAQRDLVVRAINFPKIGAFFLGILPSFHPCFLMICPGKPDKSGILIKTRKKNLNFF